jgi:hypothetical protein
MTPTAEDLRLMLTVLAGTMLGNITTFVAMSALKLIGGAP